MSEMKSIDGSAMIQRDWGYACFDGSAIWIPAVFGEGNLKKAMAEAYKEWGCKRIIFSSVISEQLVKKLRNVKRSWMEPFPEMGESVPCVEVEYTP